MSRPGDLRREARAAWQPWVAELLGLMPWDMGRLTPAELQRVADYAKERAEG